MDNGYSQLVGIFALSSAIASHLISRIHYGVTSEWYSNKWFWVGFFGSLPALLGFIGHIFLKRQDGGLTAESSSESS